VSDPAARAGKDAAPDGDGQPVRYSVGGGVATLTMDQPHNRNALTPALLSGLAAGLDAALADDGARVIVLTHAGPAFAPRRPVSRAERGLGGTPGPGRRLVGIRTRRSRCWPGSPGTAWAAASGWRRRATVRRR
jgi:hypothetical protein